MDGSTLPSNVQNFINIKQQSSAWRDNQYRTNGILNADAFQRAYERVHYTGEEKEARCYESITTLNDLQSVLYKQAETLWENQPWSHFNVRSHIFTLEELNRYVQKRSIPTVYAD